MLFGEYDQNLARIEQELGVSLVSRGNQLAISGPPDSVDAARETLNTLYQRLKHGQSVDRNDVDAVLRMARSAGGDGNLFDRFGQDGTAGRPPRGGGCARPPAPAAPLPAVGGRRTGVWRGAAGAGREQRRARRR